MSRVISSISAAEHFAGAVEAGQYDLSANFVNRLFLYSGSGSHIPIVNCRLALDLASGSVSYANTLNITPRTRDYVNPCDQGVRDGDNRRRISVGAVMRFDHSRVTFGYTEIAPEMLKTIFNRDVVQMPRRPKAPSKPLSSELPEAKK